MEREIKNIKDTIRNINLDHRALGVHKELFCFPREGGPGLPFWLPKGYKLIEVIRDYVNKFQEEVCGIQLVKTPILGKKQLYENTGHLQLYSDNVFESIKDDGEEFILRPMTCPHHILLAKEMIQGYRQLPFLIGENSILHRNEYSGGLLGLKRVRTMELIDTHIFCLENQSHELINSCLDWIWTLLKKFRVEVSEIVLATKSEREKYLMTHQEWEKVEDILFTTVRKWAFKQELYSKLTVKMGDAAFYGPKIDFNVIDYSNQTFTISTLQLDPLMSSKLGFQIYNSEQNLISPWIIHLGLVGTLERLSAYLLEKWKGELPFWLNPIQVMIIPLDSSNFQKESVNLFQNLIREGIRVGIDNSGERFQKRLFNAVQKKIRIQVLIGEKESKDPHIISFRELGTVEPKQLLFPEFVDYIRRLSFESQEY